MIKKLKTPKTINWDDTPEGLIQRYRLITDVYEKINEIIDWIDDVSALHITDKQVTANLPNIDAGELAFLSKENSDLKDEVDLLQKQLEIAVDALKTVRRYTAINQFAPKSREAHIVAKKAVAEITAIEQKDIPL